MPLFDLVMVSTVLMLVRGFVEGEKRVELAHLGLEIERIGEGFYLADRYRIVKTFDLKNLEVPVKPMLSCKEMPLPGNSSSVQVRGIAELCERLAKDVDNVEAIFTKSTEARSRRGLLTGLFRGAAKGVRRLFQVKRSGIRYERLVTDGARAGAKKGKLKSFLISTAAGAGGSAAYDVLSAPADKLVKARVKETEIQREEVSDLIGVIDANQDFLKVNNLNNNRVEQWARNVSVDIDLLYRNESVTRAFVQMTTDQQSLSQYVVQYLLWQRQLDRLKRIVSRAHTGYLSSELADEEEIQAELNELRETLASLNQSLVLRNISEYYRIPIASVASTKERIAIQIDIPVAEIGKETRFELLQLKQQPFRCPVENCSGMIEWKFKDDLIVTSEQFEILGTDERAKWFCTPGSAQRLCYREEHEGPVRVDECIKSILENDEFRYECSAKFSNEQYRPVLLKGGEIYETREQNGQVIGQFVKKDRSFGKIGNFTFANMSFMVEAKGRESGFFGEKTLHALKVAKNRGVARRMGGIRERAGLNLAQIDRVLSEVEGSLAKEGEEESFVGRVITSMHRYVWFSQLCTAVAIATLIRNRAIPNFGFLIVNPYVTMASALNVSRIEEAVIDSGKEAASAFNPLNWLKWRAEAIAIGTIEWLVVLLIVSTLAMIVYQLLFRVINLYYYRGLDIAARREYNALVTFTVKEKGIFSENIRHVQIKTSLQLEDSSEKLIANRMYLHQSGDMLIALTPVTLRDSAGRCRDVLKNISISRLRWKNNLAFDSYAQIRALKASIVLFESDSEAKAEKGDPNGNSSVPGIAK